MKIAVENEFVPDCKTGVAYGSILLRKSGEIKVQKTQEEIPFNFMVGRKKSKEFIDILSKDSEYNEWKDFISADLAENEIYYTDDFSNEVLGRKIINLKHKSITLEDEYEEGKYIYIRSVSPNSIEYCVSDDEKILKDILKDIEKICLDEKIPPVINEKMCKQCSYYEFCYIW